MSCNRAAFLLCICNAVAILCTFYAVLLHRWIPIFVPSSFAAMGESAFHKGYVLEALKVRKALEPTKLMKRVREIQEESGRRFRRERFSNGIRRSPNYSDRLKRLKKSTLKNNQRALDVWRKKKLHIH
ncbi:hypothetical protein KP509_35G049500 [Ceratopteris richardii]|uniref:Uncharacterized protein n=1 Tax=Ceratopteris richardii TaxID=49495 RepID=A0A8T2QHD7_CERRI|nr:hypothetical protein KP509_35G049500 [Ceratopteris richardii]